MQQIVDSSVTAAVSGGAARDFGASPAEIEAATYYDEIFVPALFAQWSAPLARAARTAPGDRVLDVACGSGIVARELDTILSPRPRVSGVDCAAGMLAVAARRTPRADWRLGDAGALPFADASFERALCQFGLMFFDDRPRALAEMRRVLAPGGRLAFAVWDSLERNPGFARKVEILERLAGTAAADALRAPFCLGVRDALLELAAQAGLREVELESRGGEARFAGLRQFIDAELRGWLPVMGVHLEDELIEEIYRECERELGAWLGRDGLVMPVTALLLAGGGGES